MARRNPAKALQRAIEMATRARDDLEAIDMRGCSRAVRESVMQARQEAGALLVQLELALGAPADPLAPSQRAAPESETVKRRSAGEPDASPAA